MTGDHSDPGSGEGVRSNYAEFRLRFERDPGPRTYQVTARGLGREVGRAFELPFSDLELENLVLRLGGARRGARGVDLPQMELAKAFGGKLFEALFESDIRSLYRASTLESRNTGQSLRIALELTNAPELQRVAWEYLYDRPLFLSTDPRTPIVRYLDLPGPISPLRVRLPLRILGLVAATPDLPNLDVDRERQRLEIAVKEPIERGQVELHWLPTGTWRDLQAALLQGPWHIFHFIGHGGFDELRGEGFVYIPDESGRATRLSSTRLGRLLGDHAPMRLAFLNSGEGGDDFNVFSITAATVVQRGTPGVVAMPFEITDRAAILFSGEFYGALAQGRAVDEALSQARMAIFADDNDIEWGAPVLFMGVSDGRLFDVEAPVAMAGVEPAATAEAERRRLEPEAAIASAAAAEQQRLEAEAAVAAERMRLEEEAAAAAAAEQRRLQQETAAEAERQRLEQRAAAAQAAAELTDAQREQFAEEERKWRDAEAAVLAQQAKARRGVLGGSSGDAANAGLKHLGAFPGRPRAPKSCVGDVVSQTLQGANSADVAGILSTR